MRDVVGRTFTGFRAGCDGERHIGNVNRRNERVVNDGRFGRGRTHINGLADIQPTASNCRSSRCGIEIHIVAIRGTAPSDERIAVTKQLTGEIAAQVCGSTLDLYVSGIDDGVGARRTVEGRALDSNLAVVVLVVELRLVELLVTSGVQGSTRVR